MNLKFQISNLCALCILCTSSLAAEPAIDFASQIQPLLQTNCFGCHGGGNQKAGLRLDNRESAIKGGDLTSKVIVPGHSDQSEMIKRIMSTDDTERMPPPPRGVPLKKEQIDLLKAWIDSGAPWPSGALPAIPTMQAEPEYSVEERGFWVFQPVAKPAIPTVKQKDWIGTPVDAFILNKLDSESLTPAPPASKLELIRRVSFDLTGLPPTTSEIDAFLRDNSPTAYDRMVDQYLASPRYGEKWAQHWFDVVRFAESEGFEYDTPIGSLWRYRDYVIDSFNNDKPYDQFVREQVAGDEIDPNNREYLVAAGFHRLGAVRRNKGNQDVASSRNEVLTERADITAAAFMGLTMGCARCHDHKFDPISHKDYYRLQAYMAATDENDIPLVSEQEQQEWRTKTQTIRRQLNQLNRQLRDAPDDQKAAINMEIEKVEDTLPPALPGINTIKNTSEPTAIHVLARGEWSKKGAPVGLRPPGILVNRDAPELPLTTQNPRTLLANWLTEPTNPLTPRVIVNRIWQHHFGKGIVKTTNDFGKNGDRPSHPQLLDYLASALVENGWRIKSIHRMILLSSAYRQGSRSQAEAVSLAKDPDNRLLWKYDRRRLTAEEIRDSMLMTSGRLNPKMGGESVFVPVDPDLVSQLYKPAQWAINKDRAEHDRRSVYLVAKRNLRLPSMEVFDQPGLGGSCPRRETSTHAPQALELLNGVTSNDLATSFAERLKIEAGSDPSAQVDLAFRLATGRAPTNSEKQLAVEFLKDQSLKEFALAMFNLNAFLYVN